MHRICNSQHVPSAVRLCVVAAETATLDVALVELALALLRLAQLGGANRGEVAGMLQPESEESTRDELASHDAHNI